MHVCGRQRLRQDRARLVVEELHLVDLEQSRKRDELGVTRPHADDHDQEIVEVTQKRPGANERVEILRMSDVARVHDDELLVDAPAS